jgi:hypothetical protein
MLDVLSLEVAEIGAASTDLCEVANELRQETTELSIETREGFARVERRLETLETRVSGIEGYVRSDYRFKT